MIKWARNANLDVNFRGWFKFANDWISWHDDRSTKGYDDYVKEIKCTDHEVIISQDKNPRAGLIRSKLGYTSTKLTFAILKISV